jgi:ABC-type uncharacterized transport system substrate-binding protein
VAAKMVLDIIEQGVAPRAIPVVLTGEFVVFMRGKAMREIGLYLPQIYESFARSTNNYFD